MNRTRANFGKKYNDDGRPVDRYQQAINAQRNSTIQHDINNNELLQEPVQSDSEHLQSDSGSVIETPAQIPLNNLYTAFSALHNHESEKPVVNENEHHSVVHDQKAQLGIWEEKKSNLKDEAKQAHSKAKGAGIPDAKNTFWRRTPYIEHAEHGTIYAGGRKKQKRKSKTRKGLKKKRKSKTRKA